MTTASITVMGLGPGRIRDLTLEAYDLLRQAAQEQQTVYFRTLIHPTVTPLRQLLPAIQIESFDRLYDESADWNTLYTQIAQEICILAEQHTLIYAVPGHPLIGESSVRIIQSLASERGLSTCIVGGLSFLEPVYAALQLDPFDSGAQLIDATELAALKQDEIAGKVIPTTPLLVAQVYNRRLASQVKLALSEYYPDDWLVKLIRAAGVEDEEQVLTMPLFELDRENYTNHLSTLYVPPIEALATLRLPETLRYITMRLRRDPDGCPWDREQTHQSLTKYVIEEAYEVVEALEENDMEKLAEELGDLLLQVYLHAEIARQDNDFSIGDVFEHINAKLIRRHPHIFGSIEVSNAGQVVQNWEAIKRQERALAGKDVEQESVLDHVPLASPALIVAQEYQKRVSRIGFEFSSQQDIYAKLEEELGELRTAQTTEEQLEEVGDLLFMVTKLALSLKIDAEEALRRANRKFCQRFQTVERMIREQEQAPTAYSAAEWLSMWKRAKALAKAH